MSTSQKVRRVRAYLENGEYVLVPKDALANFVGIDEDGNPIIRCVEGTFAGELEGITSCCGASGKGMDAGDEDDEGYVACRSCYQEVSWRLGDTYDESDIFIKAKTSK